MDKRNYILWLIALIGLISLAYERWRFNIRRQKRKDYYRNVYLQSEEWSRKRYVVLKRDNWRCVNCGAKATQVHHTRYAKKNIGKEPIDWLISVCDDCHKSLHH